MGYHRYKTHEELVNTPGVVVDTVSFGKGYADYHYGDQSVLVDIVNNNILGMEVELGKDQYFGDWFCVFVPDEIVSSPPKESIKYGAPGLVTDPFKDVSVDKTTSDIDLKFKCLEAASIYALKEGVSIIDMAEKIYKFVKQ